MIKINVFTVSLATSILSALSYADDYKCETLLRAHYLESTHNISAVHTTPFLEQLRAVKTLRLIHNLKQKERDNCEILSELEPHSSDTN